MKTYKKGKYTPFTPVRLTDRTWPDKAIEAPPIWCSVDLRDGNQALVDPMNLEEKLNFFKVLCDVGFKQIEIGFPSASDTEFEICRELIDGGHIPDDVTIQVLVQAREHLIRRTFDAVRGAKNVIVHFYNSTSEQQRRIVFKSDTEKIKKIAVDAARLVKQLSAEIGEDTSLQFEYTPESFSGTELDFSIDVCAAVMSELSASPKNKVILNLPSTVEMSTPNVYADQIEYFVRNLPDRESAIISIHPHNDRGTGVAAAELAMLAGAERLEGTLFGNGERTGNLDLIAVGLNMFTQGVNPELDFSNLPRLKETYEKVTRMHVHERHPYAGELVFTAFSGSHQDAINKGSTYMEETGSDKWDIPYLPIDPADVGRQYEPIIRINSQSGKGGAAFIMNQVYGYNLPKAMHPEFGNIVKKACDEAGRELSSAELLEVFKTNYIDIPQTYHLEGHTMLENSSKDESVVKFEGNIVYEGEEHHIKGRGNGPIDAFFNAFTELGAAGYSFASYHEHAISGGSDSKAIAYIELKNPSGKSVFGVGIAGNINMASILGVISAINRDSK